MFADGRAATIVCVRTSALLVFARAHFFRRLDASSAARAPRGGGDRRARKSAAASLSRSSSDGDERLPNAPADALDGEATTAAARPFADVVARRRLCGSTSQKGAWLGGQWPSRDTHAPLFVVVATARLAGQIAHSSSKTAMTTTTTIVVVIGRG